MPPRELLTEVEQVEDNNNYGEILLPTTCSTILNDQDNDYAHHNNETSFLLPKSIINDDDDNDDYKVPSSSAASLVPLVIYHEIIEQSKTFLPTLQSLILSKIPWFITLRILGEMDDDANNNNADGGDGDDKNGNENGNGGDGGGVELAAAALATTLCNVTGLSLCIGFSFALSTLAGQAKGEMFSRPSRSSSKKNNDIRNENENENGYGNGNDIDMIGINTPIIFLLRGLIVQILLVLPVGIWWIYGIESFLIQLGQTPILAKASSEYLKILAPSLWIYSIQWTLTAWTQSLGLASIPATASLLGLILHIPFNYLFVYYLDWGYLGCAYATICFQTIQLLYISIYLFVYKKGKLQVLHATGGYHIGHTCISSCFKKELWIASTSLQGYKEYLALAIPGIIVISEWWASETAIFLSGTLQPNPQTTLAAMTIYQSINSFWYVS
jgi:Na+-driven multidrug efflux pump